MAGQKPTDFDARLGARLVELRIRTGATQRAIAEAIGISAAQVQKYEKGVNAVAARDVQVIARLLGVDVMTLYDPQETAAAQPAAPDGDAIDPARAEAIRGLITAVGELLSVPGPKGWVPTPGERVVCSGGAGTVTGINMVTRKAGVRFDDAPSSGTEPLWAFGELTPAPQEDARTILARMAEVPPEGSEERFFWLEAAEQHGASRADDGVHTATDSAVLKLMSEARAQGHLDAMRVLAGVPAPQPEASPGTPPAARVLRDTTVVARLDGDRITIDCAGADEPGLAGELYRALTTGGTAVAVVVPALAPPVTEADQLVRTDLSATAAELRDLLETEPGDVLPAVIGTCKGEWRREAFDRWQAYDHADQADDEADAA